MAFKHFKYLNIPDSWERYWTKYPQGMTILESLFEWVSQVDSMTDNVNNWNDYLNDFVSKFDTELQSTVTTILQDWNTTGFLQELINTFTNERIDTVEARTTSLETVKVDKGGLGQINWANIAQDARENITGGTTAVVGVESTGQINLTPNAVTVYETDFLQKGKNLLDEHNLIHGHTIDRTTGGVTPTTGFFATRNWVRVRPGETLHKNFVGNYVWGDESQSPFGGGSSSTPAGELLIPQNAYFIKFSLPTNKIGSAQLEYGNVETSYEKGTVRLQKGISMDGEYINDESLPTKKLTGFVQSKNLLNPRRIIKEHYIASATGLLVASKDNDTYTNIYIPTGTTELRVHDFSSGAVVYAFKTESGAHIAGKSIQPTDSKVIVVPSGANTINISFSTIEIPNAMLSVGSSVQEYEEYYRYLVDLKEPHSSDEKEVGSRLTGKNVVFFGDSLTGMYGDSVAYPNRVKDILGLNNVYNVGFSGTRMSDTSTVQYKDFSLTNLVDSIIANDYTMQENSVEQGSTMYAPHFETLKGIDWDNVDIVSIFYGANDYSGRVPLDNENDSYDKNTFMGACRYAVKLLTEAYPHLKFILATPSYRYDTDGVENNIGLLTEDYVQAIHDLQKDLKIPVIDVFHDGQINQFNYVTYLQPDGLHFIQSTGLSRIADLFASQMESYL